VLDEIANGAFWVGLMIGMAERYDDVSKHLDFADVRDNFEKAARIGLDAQFSWFEDKKVTVNQLVLKELLPIARSGLKKMQVDAADINRYLKVIEQRAKEHMNGARWQLRAYTKLLAETTPHEAITCLTAAIINNQEKEIPVHKWKLPELSDLKNYRPNDILVEEFMSTDLVTVQKDDIIELVAEMMDYRRVRFTPVEDTKGKLVGLVTSFEIMHYLLKHEALKGKSLTVKDIMDAKPITISPDANIKEAMRLMREHKIGCLPVVQKGELVGIVTEMDFLRISRRLIEQLG
jgi:CBS domain-containing protein